MKHFIIVLGLLGCSGMTANQRKAEIEKAEDKFCEIRAKEKALEESLDASAPAQKEETSR